MASAYYSASIQEFLQHDAVHILGALSLHHQFAVEDLQKNAWLQQISILQHNLSQLGDGHILFEYSIPRMGKRVDVVLLIAGIIVLLEFKVGETRYTAYALDQALDYALDLKNFHEQSHARPIVPVVVATGAEAALTVLSPYGDGVYAPVKANRHNLSQVIAAITTTPCEPALDPAAWRDSPYKPTPTIIQAAQALYENHSVEEIS